MRRIVFCAAFLLAASSALAQSTAPGGDINALPSGPKSTTTRDSQQDARDAYEQARAECRQVARDERRACVTRAQRDYDKTLHPPGPPRPVRRAASAGR
jgi:hypothetical protein